MRDNFDPEEMECMIWILIWVCLVMGVISLIIQCIEFFIFAVLTAIIYGLGKWILLRFT